MEALTDPCMVPKGPGPGTMAVKTQVSKFFLLALHSGTKAVGPATSIWKVLSNISLDPS